MQMLLQELQVAIAACSSSGEQNIPIPTLRVKQLNHICFSSPIPLRLARTWQRPALEIAEQLVIFLQVRFAALAQAKVALFDITLTIDSAAWICCQPSDRCLAAWLQQIVNSPPQLSLPDQLLAPATLQASPQRDRSITNPELHQDYPIFFLQYTHARCCALIRLARSQGLLHLGEANGNTLLGWICRPSSVAWLKADQLRLVHPAEHRLMIQLFTLPSALARQPFTGNTQQTAMSFTLPVSWPLPERPLRLQARALSDAFHHFHRDCQIWGSKADTSLAQARCGLVLATQSVLRFVLQDLLGIHAPLEL